MLKNLAIALIVVAAVAVAMGVVLRSQNVTTAPQRDSSETTAPGASGQRARATLAQIAETSQSLMPEGYGALRVSMPLAELRRVRPLVRRDARSAQRDDGLEVWEEDDPSGARVIYLVSTRSQIVTQVQFASRVESPDALRGHFDAMEGRYGHPTGIWDCPETEQVPPLRRFTWRREGASVMEAVLVTQANVALTLVIAANEDIATALRRSQCRPIPSGQSMPPFPLARTLRGEQTPFMRVLVRDR